MICNPVINDETTNPLHLSYRPWKDDPLCRNHIVRFNFDCDLPEKPLVSYPGSGNTYIRAIIERLTGIFTGSRYTDKDLYVAGILECILQLQE
jgi:hypothetical protein